jgi:hypothetical protein
MASKCRVVWGALSLGQSQFLETKNFKPTTNSLRAPLIEGILEEKKGEKKEVRAHSKIPMEIL